MCKRISNGDLTRKIVQRELNLPVPRKLAAEWTEASKAQPEELSDAEKKVYDELVAQIMQTRSVVEAKRRFEKLARAALLDLKLSRKRERAQLRNIVCGVDNCEARFASEDALSMHRKRRHVEAQLDRFEAEGGRSEEYIEEDPLRKLSELRQKTKKRKKNRLGQRARRREAIKKQIAAHQAAIKRGEKPPPYQRIEIPGRTRAKVEGSEKANRAAQEEEEESKSEELHPSWAAKKKEKDAVLTQFKGSRIVFD